MLVVLLGGAGSIALGLAYVLHLFGPTEAEVVLWGRVSICVGLALTPVTVGLGRNGPRIVKGIAGLGWGAVAALQMPPIVLWLAFHGSGISDGAPPSAFVAHWAYAIPHLALLGIGGAIVHGLVTGAMPGPRIRSRPPL